MLLDPRVAHAWLDAIFVASHFAGARTPVQLGSDKPAAHLVPRPAAK